MPATQKTPGFVVTHNPPAEFSSNLRALLEQLLPLLVVDNGSGPETRRLLEREAQLHPSLQVQFNDSNLGIAAALNQGFRWALAQGYERIISFDQDSQPAPNMVAELLQAYDSHPRRERIAILAPQIQDSVTGGRITYLKKRGMFSMQRVACQAEILDDVLLVITSGSLNNLAAYQELGGFREDFFIDYVDTEYCLRAAQHGYKIVVACKAVLHHRLGGQQRKQIGALTLRPTFHSSLRWYYINRNRIAMLGMYAFKTPYWALYDVMVGGYAFLKMLLYEDQKLKKILAVAMGIIDGLFRRMGPITPSRKCWLIKE
jgi:rhamnosyltransferase